MKNVRIILPIFACLSALTTAFAIDYNPLVRKWYSRNPNSGVPVQQLQGQPTCVTVTPIIHCAAEYDVNESGQIVAGPFNAQMGQIQD